MTRNVCHKFGSLAVAGGGRGRNPNLDCVEKMQKKILGLKKLENFFQINNENFDFFERTTKIFIFVCINLFYFGVDSLIFLSIKKKISAFEDSGGEGGGQLTPPPSLTHCLLG